jgi:hypothetical protein
MSIFFNEVEAQNNQFISGVLVLYWYYIAYKTFIVKQINQAM